MATTKTQGTLKMPMQTPTDLFVHELSDIHSAEQIIVKMLREAQGMATNPQLRQALTQQEQETRQQAQNLDQIFQQLGQQRHPVTCHAVEGLQKELEEVRKTDASSGVLDGVILGGAMKTEHYEISAYQGLVKKAQAMGEQRCAELLQQNLQQEQQTLQTLIGIGDQMLQQLAGAMQATGSAQQATSPI